ncbi:Methyl-accepting chemotaxis protein I (serine chemoreceptor protein) [Caballeronia sordidicola]|uniref:Methyl-accepting chemotaxis protein I (Serine chemoreceptor protein) n=2 Tax=Burkholderiales TaxID=80840 RepID=A0A242MAI9_CABSO|nr:Methyl-accepting chemotaxis protein I (serine chemoreceptor protein) [Caballeronia sordidicola]
MLSVLAVSFTLSSFFCVIAALGITGYRHGRAKSEGAHFPMSPIRTFRKNRATGRIACAVSAFRLFNKTKRYLRNHARGAFIAMFNNFTIRRGLTITIAGYTLAIVAVLLAAAACLRQSNQALEQMVATDTAAITHLKTSSQRLLQVRLALGNYETLFMLGKASDDMLPNARKTLKISDAEFDAYLAKPRDTQEEQLAQAARTARTALIAKALNLEFDALAQNDFNTFRTLQVQTADGLYATYDHAMSALEALQIARQQARYEQAQRQFHAMATGAVVIAALALVLGFIARGALSAAVMKPIESAIHHFEQIAAGDLTATIDASRDNEMGRLFAALRRMQQGLVGTVTQVRGGTGAISHGAREIAAGNIDLSQRTEEQAASLQQTASSMEQLTATVRQNADNARQASELAVDASTTAVRGGDVVGKFVHTMDDIATSSTRIADIIGVIEGIAFQTNILALNAAVEAARAGEEGRGFAVVAGEVRSLAQRSAAAAKEIKELISASADKVQTGNALAGQAGQTMGEVVAAVKRVSDIIGEISAASSEQTGGIELINRAVAQMDEVTQQNAALVEEAAAAAASLEQQAERLDVAVAVFRV